MTLLLEETRTGLTAITLHPSDRPVEANPDRAEYGTSGHMLWVTRVESPNLGGEHVGSFVRVDGSAAGDGWIARNDSPWFRCYGAVVDPAPANGHHYRVLNGYVVRYNDDDHRGDRHNPDHPWSIVGGIGDAAWIFPNDSTSSLDGVHYVEIEDPLSTGRQQEPEDPGTISNDGVTRGWAVADGDGAVALKPAPVAGKQYLVWVTTSDAPILYVATWIGTTALTNEEIHNGFLICGYYRHGDNDYTSTQRALPAEEVAWAELALAEPEYTAISDDYQTTRRNALAAEVTSLGTAFTDFNEALNQLAVDEGWCSEYEGIVTKLGMEGRSRRYDVEVSVDFTFTSDSVSSTIDSRFGDYYDMGSVELSSVSGSATMTVTVTGVEADDTDSLSENIDSSDVRDALDNIVNSDIDIDEVNDWSVVDWSESSDY